MRFPLGFEKLFMKEVCRLKILHGLKQSPKAWFEIFNNITRKHVFQ